MQTKLDDIHGTPMKTGTVTCLSGMTTTQLHSNSRGFEWPYGYAVQLDTPGKVEMANWCKENCENDYHGSSGSVFWSFVSETDAVGFKLRWS